MYNEIEKQNIINNICNYIEEGKTLRSALKHFNISSNLFYLMIDSNENFLKQYTRSKELQSEAMFDDLRDIADAKQEDKFLDENGKIVINHANVNRDRLRADVIKWQLSKMFPKKFGDSLNIESKNENINENKVQTIKIIRTNKEENKE